MKLLLLSVLLFSTVAFAKNSDELFSNAQRETVRREIDNICGDTWCEGDYNFRFNEFTCDKSTHACELNFQFISMDDSEVETFSPVQVCRFENIRSYKDLMEDKYSLNEHFYEAISECISDKESQIEF